MTNLRNFILRVIHDEQAQDLVEYSLLAGFVAVTAGATIPDFASSFSTVFSKMASVSDKAGSA